MYDDSMMYEEIAVTFAEIIRNLKSNYPSTLDKILSDIDLGDKALDEYLELVSQ